MNTSEEQHQLLGLYILGGLDRHERATFLEHLADCPECRREAAELESLPDLLDALPRNAALDLESPPPHEVEQRTRELVDELLEDGEYWNVNLPHLPPGDLALPARRKARVCRAPLLVSYESEEVAPGRIRHQYNARYANRPVEAGSDVEICFGGEVAVSRLHV